MRVSREGTKVIIQNMRAEGQTSRADYLDLMAKRIVELDALWDKAITAAALKVQDAVNYLVGDDNVGALNTALHIRDRINALLRTAAPQPTSGRAETRDNVLMEAYRAVRATLYDDDTESVKGAVLSCADAVETLRTTTPQPEPRMFPMTDGPDLPWPLAEEIYGSDAFDYFEQSRHLGGSNGLEEMAKSDGWSWRALADCFETHNALCDSEAESEGAEKLRDALSRGMLF